MPSKRYYASNLLGTGTRADPFRPALQDMVLAFTVLTGATNASPIVITASGHGLATRDRAHVRNVLGNTAANGGGTITRINVNSFSLDGSTGNGIYIPGTGEFREDGVAVAVQSSGTVGGQAICQANITRHSRLDTDARNLLLPDATLGATWGSIGTAGQRTALIVALTLRGWDVSTVTDDTTFGELLRLLGRRFDAAFDEQRFGAGA